MEYIEIKNTDLKLSAVGLGTVNAGLSWDGEDAYRIFEQYLEAGGNLIDTAHVYSDWVPGETARAERVTGDWIRNRRKRDDFILMTKGGHPRCGVMDVSRLSRKDMTEDLESSLKQLSIDYVDIYFYHRDDVSRTVEELVETMEQFCREGKIRYYGCSNWTTVRMKEADQYCRSKGYRGFVANQALYNIGTRYMKPYPDPTMVVCGEEMLDYGNSGNLLMPYMGVCSGFFHNLKEKGIEAVTGSCYFTPENVKLGTEIFRLCEKNGFTITQALLGFFATREFPVLPLMSADNMAQLSELNRVFSIRYEKKDYEFIK